VNLEYSGDDISFFLVYVLVFRRNRFVSQKCICFDEKLFRLASLNTFMASEFKFVK